VPALFRALSGGGKKQECRAVTVSFKKKSDFKIGSIIDNLDLRSPNKDASLKSINKKLKEALKR
jgi:hypothetical protein